MSLRNSIFNWSSGKDSAMALYKVLQEKHFEIKSLFTTVNGTNDRVSMHGVRTKLLDMQAENIGLPLYKLFLPEMPSMEDYNHLVGEAMAGFKAQDVKCSVFGDIFLEDLKKYREEQLKQAGMEAVFPLWGRPSAELMKEYLDCGFKAIVVCVNEKYLDSSFAGRIIDQTFMDDLPAGVDPCGENGEYHSFVFDGPVFRKPVRFTVGEVVYKNYPPADASANYDTGFYYCDLLPG